MSARTTTKQAVGRGVLTVNGTVMLMMFAPPLVFGGGIALLGFKDAAAVVGLALIVPSWLGAWLAWSILIPVGESGPMSGSKIWTI